MGGGDRHRRRGGGDGDLYTLRAMRSRAALSFSSC
jgi:hypothetical protein